MEDSAPVIIKAVTPIVPWINIEEGDIKAKESKLSVKCLRFAERAVYFLVLFVLTIVLLWQTWRCLSHYIEEPAYVETKVSPQHKALFPAMTICPQYNGYNEQNLKVFLIQCSTKRG